LKKEDEADEIKKRVPLSLEEILAKKKAEEEALSKVLNLLIMICVFVLDIHFVVFAMSFVATFSMSNSYFLDQ